MRKRKTIGVFIGRPDEPFQTKFLKALGREAFQNDMDVLVFSSMLRTGGYEDYQVGETRIMELVNYDMLDAVVLVPDSLQMLPDYARQVAAQIKKNFQGVCVSIDLAMPGYELVACDDVEGICEVVSHLVEVHGCTDIAFMTGPKGHPHSENRLAGYKKAMEQAELFVDEGRIFYGDFWYDEGERVVEELMESKRGLPQAVACGSDTMAVSICYALQKMGVRVPEDVLVTGYDCEVEGFEDAFITSAVRGIDLAAARAVRHIVESFAKKEKKYPLRKKSNLRLFQSCSCGRRFRFEKVLQDKREDDFFALYNFMQERLLMAKTLKECLWEIDGNAIHAGVYDKMYICLNQDWGRLDEDETEDGAAFGERMILALDTVGAQEKKAGGRVNLERMFDTKDLVPSYQDEDREPKMFYFNMLHFGSHSFGYIVLEYSGEECVFGKHYPYWVRKVNAALESLRRVYAVRDLYEEAQQRAVTDVMTGLYNRNGYNILAAEVVAGLAADEMLFVMLCDNNGLKYINDTYGHIAGDDVICLSAGILAKSHFKEGVREMNFRIGGDEYVKLMAGRFTKEDVAQYVAEIRVEVEALNTTQERKYPVYLAIGYQIYQKMEITSLDQIMTEVDGLMYQDKQRIKKTSGFDPARKE